MSPVGRPRGSERAAAGAGRPGTQGSGSRGPRHHSRRPDPPPGLAPMGARVTAGRSGEGLSCPGLFDTRLAVAKRGGFLAGSRWRN